MEGREESATHWGAPVMVMVKGAVFVAGGLPGDQASRQRRTNSKIYCRSFNSRFRIENMSERVYTCVQRISLAQGSENARERGRLTCPSYESMKTTK